jgi:hypothetical protein
MIKGQNFIQQLVDVLCPARQTLSVGLFMLPVIAMAYVRQKAGL